MARQLFPNERFIAGVCTQGKFLQIVNGLDLEVFLEATCITLADIVDLDVQPIAGSVIKVNDSQFPRFYGPTSGVTTLYVRRKGDTNADVEEIYAYGVASLPSAGYYIHSQDSPSATWNITHNLGFPPGGCTVVDSAGTEVMAALSFPAGLESSRLTINFAGATSGKAYLS